jgi:hypothetical protein
MVGGMYVRKVFVKDVILAHMHLGKSTNNILSCCCHGAASYQ